jgi:hypothetical protein
MSYRALLPSAAIAFGVTSVLCAAELLPFGKATVLVRLSLTTSEAGLIAAARSGAAYVGSPAPGYAVLYGDAARIREAAGLAVRWKGYGPCAPRA